jgi:LPPG:FO 2-phospho-L-lactate transferase
MLSKPSKVLFVITVLSGGVGAARLLSALSGETDPREITAIVNVADDLVLHGLTICPDLDTISYTLAGLNNEELGWGLRGESWRVMEELADLGGAAWFRLGDRDLATHLYRSQRLREGATKSDVTRELCAHWGVKVRLLPVTNDDVSSEFETEVGHLTFQQYFVGHQHNVKVERIDFVGARKARATPEVLEALEECSRIIIAPSNPLISIDPILEVPGVRSILERRRDDVVAVSPIINGAALKGPADRLLAEMGWEVSSVGVADFYEGLIGTLVIDEADAALSDDIRARGINVRVTTTIMADPANAQRLAQVVLS